MQSCSSIMLREGLCHAVKNNCKMGKKTFSNIINSMMTCRDKVGHNHIILKTWLLWVQHWNPLLYLSPINDVLLKKKACIPHSHCCHVSIWKLNTFTAIYKPGARVYIMLPWGLKTNHLQQAEKSPTKTGVICTRAGHVCFRHIYVFWQLDLNSCYILR